MLLVSDREEAQNLPRIIGDERLLICAPAEAVAGEDDIIVIDVDLADTRRRKALRRLFREQRPRRILAVAIDFDNRSARRAARAFGATTVLTRPVTAGILYRFVEGFERDPGPEPIASAMTQGASALADAFSAFRNEHRLDLGAIRLAAADIADAVADCGIAAWLDAVARTHDGSTRPCLAMAGVAGAFGQQIGMGEKDVTLLTMAALLADLGIGALPRSLIDKTGPLSRDEVALYCQHPVAAHAYLKAHSAVPEAVFDAIRHHHELVDGSGYPDGLAGNALSDLARVLTVCDLLVELVDPHRQEPQLTFAEALDVLAVMAREKKIAAGHVAVLEAAFVGRIGWPEASEK